MLRYVLTLGKQRNIKRTLVESFLYLIVCEVQKFNFCIFLLQLIQHHLKTYDAHGVNFAVFEAINHLFFNYTVSLT